MGRSVTPVCSIVMVTIIADQPITGNAVGAAHHVSSGMLNTDRFHVFADQRRNERGFAAESGPFDRLRLHHSPRLRLAAIQNRADHLG